MEKFQIDNCEYPLRVIASGLKKLISRDCPCVVVFMDPDDPYSRRIICYTTLLCRKYPRVICYKVGWYSHLNYYQNIQPSDKYDITIWKSSKKILVYNKPEIFQITHMFNCVQNEYNGQCSEINLNSLREEPLKDDNKKIENPEMFKMDKYDNNPKVVSKSTFQNYKLSNSTNNVSESFEIPSRKRKLNQIVLHQPNEILKHIANKISNYPKSSCNYIYNKSSNIPNLEHTDKVSSDFKPSVITDCHPQNNFNLCLKNSIPKKYTNYIFKNLTPVNENVINQKSYFLNLNGFKNNTDINNISNSNHVNCITPKPSTSSINMTNIGFSKRKQTKPQKIIVTQT